MIVRYFIPEDGDSDKLPNAFIVPMDKPTLNDIRQAFPLEGDFHFRMTKQVGPCYCWFDLVDPNEVLPYTVLLKVVRSKTKTLC